MLEYKNLSRRLTKNMMTLLGFGGVFKLLTVVLAVPIFSGFLKLTMWLTGYHYLTAENIPRFLTHPLFLIVGVVVKDTGIAFTGLMRMRKQTFFIPLFLACTGP